MNIMIKAHKNIVHQNRKRNPDIQVALYHLLFIISCVPIKTWYDLLKAIPATYGWFTVTILISLMISIPITTIIGSWSLLNYLFEITELSKEKYKTMIFITISLILDLISIIITIQYSIIPIAIGFWVIQGLIIIALIVLKIEE